MPPLPDENGPDPGDDVTTDDTDDQEVDDFDKRLRFYAQYRGWGDEAASVESGDGYEAIATKLADDDRGSPEAKALLDELNEREESARAAAAEEEAKKAAADDAALKEQLKRELDEQRAADAAKAQEEERRQRILAELQAEEAGGSPAPDPLALAQTRFDEAHAVVTDMSRPIAERAAAAERGIAAGAALEAAPWRPDREALAAAAAARLKRIQEGS